MEITKEKFEAYERVRSSGVTNMFLVTNVCRISGLVREEVIYIMQNYKDLCNKFPEIRKL